MNKITLTLLVITTLLYSCGSDDDPDNSGNLLRVDRTFNNTGNTASINYEDGDKVKTFYYGSTLTNNFEYDADGKMTKFTIYSENEVDREYTFTYDSNGKITSVHDFYARPFLIAEPVDQDRTVTWEGNKMSIPLLVDDSSNLYNNYEFSFNDNNLLSKYKVTKWDGSVKININFAYDNNKNVIRLTGFYNLFSLVNIDIESTYDSKINPYLPHYNKYYLQNLIIYGARPGSGFSVSDLLAIYNHLGNNNPLLVDRNNSNALYFTYDYNGDKPSTSYYRNSSDVITTTTFVYE